MRRWLLSIALLLSLSAPARAWNNGGHMVIAAIAYDQLKAADPAALERLLAILEKHPDRGAFTVAAGDLEGEAHDRALFLECARWPDDSRGTAFDHPLWHHAFRPIVRGVTPPASSLNVDGDAEQALVANAARLADPKAPAPERAVALCWVLHLVGDMHQPLHAASLFSPAFPYGDHGGALRLVADPSSGKTISLHWLWDGAIQQAVSPQALAARARSLEARYPRPPESRMDAETLFRTASDESYALADSAAEPRDWDTTSSATPLTPSAGYLRRMHEVAEARGALAGHRLADLLETLARP